MANLLDMLAGAAAPDEYRQMMGPATLGPLAYLISRLSGTNDVLEQSMRGYLGAKPSYSVMDERAPLLRNAYRGAEVAGIVDDALPGMMVAGEAAGKGARAMQEAHELAAKRGAGETSVLDMFMPRRVPGEAYAIDVWHGSPHKFDRFDSSRIGTGEGAQAYGHGGYFAEAKDVGSGYAERLANSGVTPSSLVTVNDVSLFDLLANERPIVRAKILSHLTNANGDVGKAKETLDAFVSQSVKSPFITDEGKASLLRAKELMNDFSNSKVDFSPKPTGYLYKARLAWPDAAREASDPLGPQHFLDWDKPLYRQNKQVSRAISDVVDSEYGAGTYAEWLRNVRPDFRDLRSHMFDQWDESVLSKKLNERGIPGITYLDAMSRASGQGTRNYVTFDDNLIKLLERNGEPLR